MHVLRIARVGREDLEQAWLRDLADRQVGRAGAVRVAVLTARLAQTSQPGFEVAGAMVALPFPRKS